MFTYFPDFPSVTSPVTRNFTELPSPDFGRQEKVPAGGSQPMAGRKPGLAHYDLLVCQQFRSLDYLKWQE